jgi:hypothetical protein
MSADFKAAVERQCMQPRSTSFSSITIATSVAVATVVELDKTECVILKGKQVLTMELEKIFAVVRKVRQKH